MPKTVSAKEFMKRFTPVERREIHRLTAEMAVEEMTIQELRKARQITQASMAKKLGVTQDNISRLESREDILVSTLRNTIEAMGGTVSIVASFPDRNPVVLSWMGGEDEPKPRRRRAS